MSDKIKRRGSCYEYNSTFNRQEKQRNRIEIVQVNFLIIREIFNIIKDNRTPNSMFWMYLLDMEPYSDIQKAKKAETTFSTLITSGNGDCKKHAKKLISFGISTEYFAEEFIHADEKIITAFLNYIGNNMNKKAMSECRDTLIKYIFTVKNLNGTLIIDCIRNMLLDMYDIPQNQYNLAQQIIEIKATTHLTQNNLTKYYTDVVREYKEKLDSQLSEYNLPELPEGKMSNKKIYNSNSYKGSETLFYIRETYSLLASMNNINNHMDNFYKFIGISESDYQQMIDSENIPNTMLIKIFEPYKYPASLFRGDNPTSINICSEIIDAYGNYQSNSDIECFRTYLKVYLCYKISTDNINLIFPTCSLIEDMIEKLPYTDFLTPEELELYHSIKLAETISESNI